MRYSKQALEEQATYKLTDNPLYLAAVDEEVAACERRKARYGYMVTKDTCTRNMIKALRMVPYINSPQDWARLHVTEAAMKSK
jgi:hypothetical protein